MARIGTRMKYLISGTRGGSTAEKGGESEAVSAIDSVGGRARPKSTAGRTHCEKKERERRRKLPRDREDVEKRGTEKLILVMMKKEKRMMDDDDES